MKFPMLLPGDEFATRNPMALGCLINVVQSVQAVDNKSEYTHAGIITDRNGATLESIWTVKSQNIREAYRGEKVIIARNINMTFPVYAGGYAKIKNHIGQWYPVPRLLLHLVGLAKWIHWNRVVCSELVAKFETGCAEALPYREAGFFRNWYGVNPDNLVDRWKISKYYEIIFEGIIEEVQS